MALCGSAQNYPVCAVASEFADGVLKKHCKILVLGPEFRYVTEEEDEVGPEDGEDVDWDDNNKEHGFTDFRNNDLIDSKSSHTVSV